VTVDLFQCSRCRLKFEWVGIPTRCPACRLGSSVPKGEIILMGRDVTVGTLRSYGLATGLLRPEVRRGLAGLDLGYCPHGLIAAELCNNCLHP
jgi:hypothetical protein